MGLFDWIFRIICNKVFDRVDVDKSGFIEGVELELAVLYVYNGVNKRLPGWQDPPTRDLILASLKEFDKDGNGRLDKEEFFQFAKIMCRSGPDTFFARIGKNTFATTAVLPGATYVVSKAAAATPIGNVPMVVLAPIIGALCKSVRAFIPA